MVDTLLLKPLPTEKLEEIGFSWHTDSDGTKYISDQVVQVTHKEATRYYEVTNELYDMFITAAEHVIENNLFFELGIPFNLIDIIKKSWDNDVHWHIYGRFDLAGGIDGKDIKLIEFNADTPTALFETALLQWAILKYNNLDESQQFNNVYEAISKNFKRLITLFDEPENFNKYYEGWKILFSSISNNEEEEATTRLLQQMATDAGFATSFEFIEDVFFDSEGLYDKESNKYEYWFKLYPWEDIAIDEPELATILTEIVENQKAIILNPPYTLLFQSKGILPILYELFPNSPYLLKSSFKPLTNTKQVEKPVFGREGANISIIDQNNKLCETKSGPYGNYKKIYQEYYEFPKDKNGKIYQAGVFFAYEACGLGYRSGEEILDNMSKFVGHILV
jgi:glutathionylspermidine synthase